MSEELKFGDKEVFSLLKEAMNDANEIEKIYSSIINKLLASEYWSTNNKEAPRVKWYDGETAKESRREVFNCSGLYLWGAGKVPRYIGKTEQAFKKRFSRYIFSENSQCNLAKKYEKEIIPEDKGIYGFPPEIIASFEASGRSVRLRHAVDFARHGINDIWFALFPANEEVTDYIGAIEEILIRVANNWNIRNKLDPLINEQHM